MKKRVLEYILAFMLLCMVVIFSSCGEKECEHSYSGTVTKEATCANDGIITYTCSLCTNSYTEVIPAILQGTDIKSDVLKVEGDRIYGSVSNTTEVFSFLNDITVNENTSYELSKNIECYPTIPNKTSPLEIGDNIFYILVSSGTDQKRYTVTIRRLPVYNVSFDTNGGSDIESKIVQEGNQISEPVIEKSDYDFVCWRVNGEEISFPYTVTEEVEIEAIWAPTVYDIEYNLNGGTNSLSNPSTYTVETETITLANPTRTGYGFDGWYTNSDFTGEAVTEITLGSHSNIELYSKWEAIFTVSGNVITGLTEYGKTNHTEIVIPSEIDGVIITSIGSDAFRGCNSLTNVTIGNGVTNIGSSAFAYCRRLTNVTIGNGVTNIDFSAFYKCSSLKSVAIGNGVTSIRYYAFDGCSSLENVYISDIAKWCNISFDDGSANPLYYADNLYLNGELVTELVITDGITVIPSYAFSCNSLTSIIIPDGVTSIGSSAFWGCSSLTSIAIPSSVTSIRYSAFDGCSSLVEVYNLSSLDVSSYFSNEKIIHTSLEEESILESVGDYIFMTWEGKYYLIKYTGADTEIVLPENYNGNDYAIYDYAFYNCDSLTSITIPDSVTSIGEEAFYYCDRLVTVTIGNGVTSIGSSAFEGCSSLVEVYNLSSLNVSSYFDYEKVIHTSLEEESILESVGDYIFMTWQGKYYLIRYTGTDTEIVLPENYNGNDYAIYDYAFYNCSSMTSIEISDSVTSIGYRVFHNCSSLTRVTIGNGVKSIGERAFYNCSSLTSITIPDSVTSIGNSAFYNCSSLTSVTIGNSVTSIGYYAFAYCSSHINVYYKGSADNWTDISISSNNFSLTAATRYYYSKSEPTEDGNYWHYDSDGNIKIW